MNKQKKLVCINDLSGASRCSISVSLPIISSLGINTLVMPTCLLSNHTGYESYSFNDLTDTMGLFTQNWKKLNLDIDSIYTGFLGSEKQIEIILDFIKEFKKEDTLLIVDPVMGDNGIIYDTYTPILCEKMKRLVSLCDVCTPNITEACALAGFKYKGETLSSDELSKISDAILALGAKNVIITGYKSKNEVANFVSDGKTSELISSNLIPKYYTGTGDVFASCIAGLMTNGYGVFESVKFTTDFIHKVTSYSYSINMDVNEGICFEPFLPLLNKVNGFCAEEL